MTAGDNTCRPSILPLFMNAMMKRDRSPTFVNIDPAGQLAALSAKGRTTVGVDFPTAL